MQTVKRMLASLLSQRMYLRTLHRAFFFLYRLGWLKRDPQFKYHYFIRKVVQKDFTVIDLGANLGYFARTFSDLASNGKVICIEPVPIFHDVLTHFLGRRKNVEIHNVALGKESGEATMVMPESDGFIRTGLPHISADPDELSKHRKQEVRVMAAHEFMDAVGSCHYLKCDIEGYEGVVIPEIIDFIGKHRPLVQIEMADENTQSLQELFRTIRYVQCALKGDQLIQEFGTEHVPGDYLFIPEEKLSTYLL
jgi:FkbM family methyltransferase